MDLPPFQCSTTPFFSAFWTAIRNNGTKLVAEIVQALGSRDLETVRLRAHTLKGASASVGALALQGLSARLEEAAAAHSLLQATAVYGDIETGLSFARTAVATTRAAP
jgi:HPt (histidine-containing phosphotransfer) domain-containing protein